MLIGLIGKKGVGKDTVANIMITTHYLAGLRFEKKQFAAKLKKMTAELLGCSVNKLEDWDFKETVIPELGKSPREILQLLGTEFGRNMIHEDVWVKTALAGYTPMLNHDWIFTDVRFPNEADAIHNLGGKLIKITRPGTKEDSHPSETALDDYKNIDYYINNDGDVIELEKRVRSIIKDFS